MFKHLFLALAALVFLSAAASAANITQEAFQDIENYLTGMEGIVVDADKEDNVLIDIGSGKKAVPGLKLTVFQEGEDIIHPVTGKVLGKKQGSTGTLTVAKVEPEFSIASFSGSTPDNAAGKDNKTEASKLPVKSDKVGIQLPLKVTISFDNATDEDTQIAKSIVSASNIYKESDEAGAYKLALRRTGTVISYTLTQPDGTVIFSGMVMQAPGPVADGLEPLFSTSLPKGRYVSIALGKIYRDDPKFYMAGIVDDKIVTFDPSKSYAQVEEVRIKNSQLLNLETADLDGDGQDEIFITNVINGSEASSFVYKHDGKELKQIQKNIPWLFRSVRGADGSRRIIAQKLSNNGEYSGEIYYFKYAAGGKYVEDKPIKGTLGKYLFGFSVYQSEDKGELYLNIGRGSKFSISSFRKIEYNVPGYYGDTFHILPIREKKTSSGRASAPDTDAMAEYLDKLLFVNPRIEIVDAERFAIVQNELYTRVFSASPVFSESAILLYTYKYGILKKVGAATALQPIIADIWVYEDKGNRYLVALTSNNTWIFQTGASSITVYELP